MKYVTDRRKGNNLKIYIDGNYDVGQGNHVYIYALGVYDDDSRNEELLIEDYLNKDWNQQYSHNLMYIGSTINPVSRLLDHYCENGKSTKELWMKSLRKKGKKPFMRLLRIVHTFERIEFESHYCRLLYSRVQHQILNRSLLPELKLKEYRLDLEPLFNWDKEAGCFSIG